MRMAKALYDLCRKDGTVMVYSITGPEVAAAIGCKLQDVYNSACYGQLIQHTYYAEVIDRPLSRRKDITLLTEYDRVRKVLLRKYRSISEKRVFSSVAHGHLLCLTRRQISTS